MSAGFELGPDGHPRFSCKSHQGESAVDDEGNVNWAAAFAADDGVGNCEKCAHLRGGNQRWIAYHPCWHEEEQRP